MSAHLQKLSSPARDSAIAGGLLSSTPGPCALCAGDHPEAAHRDAAECHRQVAREIGKARKQLTTVETWLQRFADLARKDKADK